MSHPEEGPGRRDDALPVMQPGFPPQEWDAVHEPAVLRPTQALLHEVSRSVFWNTALLPLVAVANLLVSVFIRRGFGLESGIYDVLLGLMNSILFYSSLGLVGSLSKFLPELQVLAGKRATTRMLWRLASARLATLTLIAVALNIWAEPLASYFNLGPAGGAHLHLLTVLLAGRAVVEFCHRALEAFLAQLTTNVLSLVQAALDFALVGSALVLGWGLHGVVGALGLSAGVVALLGGTALIRRVRRLPPEKSSARLTSVPSQRVVRFAGVTYLRSLCVYFATPAFASPALATILGGPEPVALFATSFFVAFSAVTLVVSGFRGVYRPAFVRVGATGDRALLQRAFDLVSKAQILAVVPAGVGLGVMVADYLPLLYGPPFAAAIPIARVLVALLFVEAAFALGSLILWMDEHYRPVLLGQAVLVAGAPVFIWSAGHAGLIPAALVLGTTRLASSVIGHVVAGRVYGVRYPWRFAGRVGLVSAVMGATLMLARAGWATSATEAIVLTLLGVALVVVGLRLGRVLGPEDLDVLERTTIPGKRWLLRWLAGR